MKFEIRIGKEVIESNAGLALAGKILGGLEDEPESVTGSWMRCGNYLR